MSVLIEEKLLEIMALSGIDYESANDLLKSLGGGYTKAEKIVDFLKYGGTINQIKEIYQKGQFKNESIIDELHEYSSPAESRKALLNMDLKIIRDTLRD